MAKNIDMILCLFLLFLILDISNIGAVQGGHLGHPSEFIFLFFLSVFSFFVECSLWITKQAKSHEAENGTGRDMRLRGMWEAEAIIRYYKRI